jgi:hypothetical protein
MAKSVIIDKRISKGPIDCLLVLVLPPPFVPYYRNYVDAFAKSSKRLVTVFWNRGGAAYSGPLTDYVEFNRPCHDNLLLRQSDFNAYGSFVKKFIRQNHIKNVIFTTMTLAMTLSNAFLKHIRYILDYRDFTHEDIALVKAKVNSLERRSEFTFISSPSYAQIFKDKTKLVLTHNVTWQEFLTLRGNTPKIKQSQEPFTIGFYGFMRNKDFWERYIPPFANDPRFILKIYGTTFNDERSKFVDEVIQEQKATNVFYYGPYGPKEQSEFMKGFDLIGCFYNPHDINKKMLMPNKYYDGLKLGIPLLGEINSYSGKRICDRGLGTAVDFDQKEIARIVYDYLKTGTGSLAQNIKKEIEDISKDIEEDIHRLDLFIKGC